MRKLALAAPVVYLVSLAVPFLLEHAADLFGTRGSGSWVEALFAAGVWYQRVVKIGYRKPRPHFVRIVTLRRGVEPDEIMGQNVCLQREFMARLLLAIRTADPALVVIDKWFSPTYCTAGDRGTEDLKRAMEELSRNTPVVIGQYAFTWKELDMEQPEHLKELERKGFRRSAVILAPNLPFPQKDGAEGISYGLAIMDSDTRRIPLLWPSYASFDRVDPRAKPEPRPTLAAAAVARYDPGALEQPAMRRLIRRGDHPFTSFLSEEEMRSHSALALVCNPQHAAARDWRDCGPGEGDRSKLRDLRNRIVLIGERDPPRDFHESVIGYVPGVVLQANYIESLLDDRYLKPVRSWVQILISLAWFAAIELTFRRYKKRPEFALLCCGTFTLVLALVIYNWVILQWGLYLVLWPPGALAIMGKYLNARLELKQEVNNGA